MFRPKTTMPTTASDLSLIENERVSFIDTGLISSRSLICTTRREENSWIDLLKAEKFRK